jgi:hypothetical protein
MSSQTLCNPLRNLDKAGFSANFGLWIDFNDLHFIDSPNASTLIVQRS